MPKARTFDGGRVNFPRITNRSVHADDVIAQVEPDKEDRLLPLSALLVLNGQFIKIGDIWRNNEKITS